MRRKLILGIAAAGLLSLATARGQESEEKVALPGLGWLADLAGSCWKGLTQDGKMQDTQCYGMQYGKFLRGTIQLNNQGDASGKPPYEGDSVWAWDPQKKRISFYYWSSAGTFGVSEGFIEGELVRFPDPPKVNAKEPPTRSTWSRLDENSYKVIREKRLKGAWKETYSVVYTRVVP
jgi:hypothetical protein